MKHEIKNRWTGSVMFTAEIEATEDTALSVRLGLAVRKAVAEGADLRGADLEGADLEGAYLRGVNLRYVNLRGVNLKGVDLEGANLRGADLEGADLRGVNLRGVNLEIPKIENIHKVVYAAACADGALDMSSWHTCETTHCRAGWVVHLAGEAGRKLEEQVGTPAAAYMIYRESDPSMRAMPDFYCDNDTALADMKRRAEAA